MLPYASSSGGREGNPVNVTKYKHVLHILYADMVNRLATMTFHNLPISISSTNCAVRADVLVDQNDGLDSSPKY